MLKDVSAKNCRAAEHPIPLVTANGSTEASEVADVKLSALPDPVQPYVLDHTPAVLSVGLELRLACQRQTDPSSPGRQSCPDQDRRSCPGFG